MILEKTSLKDVTLIKRNVHEDYRGTFCEIYNNREYLDNGIEVEFVRDAVSTSSKHVLRGLHYDHKTWKLIQCMYGKIYFVVADMRKESPQYLKWQSFILSDQNRHQVLVPPHHANGHLVLSDNVTFHYKMSEYYDPAGEKTLKWDDPKANIWWPVSNPILSEKDTVAAYL